MCSKNIRRPEAEPKICTTVVIYVTCGVVTAVDQGRCKGARGETSHRDQKNAEANPGPPWHLQRIAKGRQALLCIPSRVRVWSKKLIKVETYQKSQPCLSAFKKAKTLAIDHFSSTHLHTLMVSTLCLTIRPILGDYFAKRLKRRTSIQACICC